MPSEANKASVLDCAAFKVACNLSNSSFDKLSTSCDTGLCTESEGNNISTSDPAPWSVILLQFEAVDDRQSWASLPNIDDSLEIISWSFESSVDTEDALVLLTGRFLATAFFFVAFGLH